jgi:hypothetical protein
VKDAAVRLEVGEVGVEAHLDLGEDLEVFIEERGLEGLGRAVDT